MSPTLRRSLAAGLAALAALATAPAMAGARLLMVERVGCIWCERWHAEVGDAYALTPEGRAAPLQRQTQGDPLPAGIRLNRPAALTPTFVLLQDGAEIGRLEGYLGEDFFWPLLGGLLARLPAPDTPETAP